MAELVDVVLDAPVHAGFANQVSVKGAKATTARFSIGANTKVFTEDGTEVVPGSDEVGFLALGGPIPLGYYKDPEKSAKTFRTFGGNRYSVPFTLIGQTVEIHRQDGQLQIFHRGQLVITHAVLPGQHQLAAVGGVAEFGAGGEVEGRVLRRRRREDCGRPERGEPSAGALGVDPGELDALESFAADQSAPKASVRSAFRRCSAGGSPLSAVRQTMPSSSA